ncbi:expressed unknown protein [Seminavis robusta]|uniref:Uncharacterized protein n=1 Tax=Seminavis robusta TaxID=568900 RepID=A0A9N8EYY9_9STRA|nr:expressed unknown protein [Seminavis robusta]|eukprot:Sro2159_g317010.1 n/a (372) ;mRNA; r:7253-8368
MDTSEHSIVLEETALVEESLRSMAEETAIAIPLEEEEEDNTDTLDLDLHPLGLEHDVRWVQKLSRTKRVSRMILHSSLYKIIKDEDMDLSEDHEEDSQEARLVVQLLAHLGNFAAFTHITIHGLPFAVPVRPLARMFQQTRNTLIHLEMSHIEIVGDDGDFEELNSALKQLNHLESVVLEQVSPGDEKRMAQIILSSSIHTQSIKLDYLLPASTVWMGEMRRFFREREERIHLRTVAKMLAERPNIKSMELAVYRWGSLTPLVRALRRNRSLERLQFLFQDGAPSQGGWAEILAKYTFRKMIRENTVLREMNLPGSPSVQFYLRLNRLGRHHLLKSDQATQADWINAIVEGRDDVRVTHYFLSKNPSLLYR